MAHVAYQKCGWLLTVFDPVVWHQIGPTPKVLDGAQAVKGAV